MLTGLKILFGIVLVTMIVVNGVAIANESLFKIPDIVTGDPWFRATLFDAYFGFITFYCWVFYKEKTVFSRFIWFALIMLLGNIAMSTYMLIKLFRLAPGAPLKTLLLNPES